MRAYQADEPGAPPSLRDHPTPVPQAGQVRIAVSACGLNFADLLMLQGKYQEKPPLPIIPGLEVAGTIDAVGDGVSADMIGRRVAALPGYGGLAEFVCTGPENCTPLPDDTDFVTAAAMQVAYGTSHVALNHRAGLQPGETLLVTGAAGGVGLTAVELGKLAGATVIACARGPEKLKAAQKAGADHLIDTTAQDIRDTVKTLGGADVVYETIGGDTFDACLRATKPEGRILAIGFAGGTVPQVPANILLVKNIAVIGLYWGGYQKFRPTVLTESLAQLFAWQAEGRITPHVSHTLPLAECAEALALLRDRKSTGKVVVTMT